MSIPDPLKPYRLYLAMFLLNLAVVVGVIYLLRREPPRTLLVTTPAARQTTLSPSATAAPLTIQIDGAVNNPGAYRLDGKARLADALQAAGGVKSEADLSKLDLTLTLRDEMRIQVPARATAVPAATDLSSLPEQPSIVQPAPPASQTAKLNLNAASLQELDSLPGIGPALAQRIIEYRTKNNGFKSLEELKDVRGIGDALFNGLKDLVTIE